jgi:hypothetical protein
MARIVRHERNLFAWLGRVDDRFMGTAVDIDPYDALLWAIRLSAGEVAYCDAQISRLHEDELFERPARHTYMQMPSGAFELVEEKRDPETVSRWQYLRKDAADRMARYAKMAIDAGIDERRVAVAERVADILAPLLENLAEDLSLTAKQRAKLPDVLGTRLRALEIAATGGNGDPRSTTQRTHEGRTRARS